MLVELDELENQIISAIRSTKSASSVSKEDAYDVQRYTREGTIYKVLVFHDAKEGNINIRVKIRTPNTEKVIDDGSKT